MTDEAINCAIPVNQCDLWSLEMIHDIPIERAKYSKKGEWIIWRDLYLPRALVDSKIL